MLYFEKRIRLSKYSWREVVVRVYPDYIKVCSMPNRHYYKIYDMEFNISIVGDAAVIFMIDGDFQIFQEEGLFVDLETLGENLEGFKKVYSTSIEEVENLIDFLRKKEDEEGEWRPLEDAIYGR